MVHSYPTVSTADRPTLQWGICLQAALVQAHARVLITWPKMLMDPISCVYPRGKVICVNYLSMHWNPMDFWLMNMLDTPRMSKRSFPTLLAKIQQQLELDGYPASGT